MKYCILEHYIVIEVKGQQASKFLQGQLTNNVLQNNQTLFCNIKGRIIAMLEVIYQNDNIFLIMNRTCWPKTLTLLEKTAQLSRVEFLERSDLPVYGLLDQDNTSISLIFQGEQIDFKAWHHARLLDKKFELYEETIGLFLPHDLGLEKDNWIDFKKGCYRGQEIIARMHYLGKSKYHLALLANQHTQELKPGMQLLDKDNNKMGEVVDFNDKVILACLRQ
jgi:folate-binding protein YgfZ